MRDSFEAIHYFSSQPQQLLYVAAIAFAGGLSALALDRLSPRTKRHIRVLAWGAAASALSAIAGYFAFCFFSLSSFLPESGSTVWILFVSLIFAGIASYLWFEFHRAWKTSVHHDHVT